MVLRSEERPRAVHLAGQARVAGVAVSTTVRYGEGKDEYVTHVWHPDPQHRDIGNQQQRRDQPDQEEVGRRPANRQNP